MKDARSGSPSTPVGPDSELPPQSSGMSFFVTLLLVAGVGFFLANLLKTPPGGDERHIPDPGPGLIGSKAPEIKAQGWFNGTAPTDEELHGKVILIDAWAYWCEPCRRKAPSLIKLYEKYQPRGVVFLGLTSEDKSTLKRSQRFIDDTKIPWLQGYGADSTLARLNADLIPQVWIVDPTGTIVWDRTSKEDLDAVLNRLVP